MADFTASLRLRHANPLSRRRWTPAARLDTEQRQNLPRAARPVEFQEQIMSKFENRPNSALVVVDVQTKVVASAHDRDAVVANIAEVVERARAAGAPVIWVQHSSEDLPKGSEAWAIVPELKPAPGEPVIEKLYGDAFEDTTLEDVLADLRVGRLVVTGAQTDACVRSTLHGGFTRGYDMTLVSDAHTTDDMSKWGSPPPGQVITHTNTYWKYHTGPGRTAGTVAAKDVAFS
jgi:isochorismate hydrolase